MTPIHLLKWAILRKAASWGQFELADDPLTPEQIDALYEEHDKDWGLQDAREEIRASGTRTDVRDPTPWTRGLDNYEHQSSAMQAPDGTWVGWTYWYGGGKYAEPSAIPWTPAIARSTWVSNDPNPWWQRALRQRSLFKPGHAPIPSSCNKASEVERSMFRMDDREEDVAMRLV